MSFATGVVTWLLMLKLSAAGLLPVCSPANGYSPQYKCVCVDHDRCDRQGGNDRTGG